MGTAVNPKQGGIIMRFKSNLALIILFILITTITFTQTQPASIPAVINYQGRLSMFADGTVVNEILDMTFFIYDQAEGGVALYKQQKQVTVSNGLFSAFIGEESGEYGPEEILVNGLPKEIFTENSFLYIGVKVKGNMEMKPRQGIASVVSDCNMCSGRYTGFLEWGNGNVVIGVESTSGLLYSSENRHLPEFCALWPDQIYAL